MDCPVCISAGQSSTVSDEGTTATTAHFEPHRDEDGRRHHHDPNTRTWAYSCTTGHRWWVSVGFSCWCGWRREQPPVITVQPPE